MIPTLGQTGMMEAHGIGKGRGEKWHRIASLSPLCLSLLLKTKSKTTVVFCLFSPSRIEKLILTPFYLIKGTPYHFSHPLCPCLRPFFFTISNTHVPTGAITKMTPGSLGCQSSQVTLLQVYFPRLALQLTERKKWKFHLTNPI